MTIPETVQKVTDAVNRHDVDAFAACYTANAEVSDPAYPEVLRGRESVRKDMTDFIRALPDLQVRVQRVIDNGETCAIEVGMSGTHKGPLVLATGHVPATNKRVNVGGALIVRLDSQGLIAEERRYYDLAGMLNQLGLLQ